MAAGSHAAAAAAELSKGESEAGLCPPPISRYQVGPVPRAATAALSDQTRF